MQSTEYKVCLEPACHAGSAVQGNMFTNFGVCGQDLE